MRSPSGRCSTPSRREFPMLRGTIRDRATAKRRAFVRFYACEEDLSHEEPDAPLPDAGRPGRGAVPGDRGDGRRLTGGATPRWAWHDAGMLDHLSIQCADVTASAAFYDAVLPSLGGQRLMDFGAGHRLRRRADAGLLARAAHDRRGVPRVAHRLRRARAGTPSGRSSSAPPTRGPRCCTPPRGGPSTTRTTTARSSATPTATTSRPSATDRSDRAARAALSQVRRRAAMIRRSRSAPSPRAISASS